MSDESYTVVPAETFPLTEAIGLFEQGYNLYEVCLKLQMNRERFVDWVKADEKRYDRITEARRAGADQLVSTYKDKLLQEYKAAKEDRDRIMILKEIGTHIRWEAQAVHNGSYSPKTQVEHSGKVQQALQLTDEQVTEMAKEVLAKGGGSFGPTSAS